MVTGSSEAAEQLRLKITDKRMSVSINNKVI